MKLLKTICISSVIALFISCSTNDESISTENSLDATLAYEELDVSYGDSNDQKFDIYLPANRTQDTKMIILVHGGGWTSGDKSDMNAFVSLIKNEIPDIGIVNINYRLADENNSPYPMQLNDITTIIDQLKNQKEFYVISDDFGFIGTSAGAHLSLLWSYAFDSESDINMVTSIVGPTNFTDPAYLENEELPLQDILAIYGVDVTVEFLEEVSPYHQVSEVAPPTQLFYGGMDPLIPTSQGLGLRDKLIEFGITHEFTLYENAGHGWDGQELFDTWTKLKNFINVHL